MSDLVISDDTVEYDAPAFRALAEFTAANINEALVSDDPDAPYIPDGDRVARVVNVDGIAAFFDTVKNGNMVLLGMPSYDGRGPILYGSDSVAISAQTTAPDACREFVSLLLSDDIQVLYGQSTGIPVNRTAFEIAGQKNVDNRNRQREYLLRILTPEDFRMEGYNAEAMDYSVVDEFESFCEGLYGWYTNDGSINAIIREEMPAYFEGQKTLDQVIPVLEDRIQTLLNERG
jgi:ABC-type glycerol-3-phosphate transport system substrate-binding protein